MVTWEYRVVDVQALDIGDALKHRDKRATLDPQLSDRDWMSMAFQYKRQDMVWVAISPEGKWSNIPKALSEFGALGWELVTSTPPKAQYTQDRPDIFYMSYLLIFKRVAV